MDPVFNLNNNLQVDSNQPANTKPKKPGVIEVNGKEYFIRQIKVGDQVINFSEIKHSDLAFKNHIEELVKNAIKARNEEPEASNAGKSHKVTLSSAGAKINDDDFDLPHHKQVLQAVNETAIPVFKKQETAKTELQKHTFTKDVPSSLKAVVIRTGAVALAVLSSPFTIPIGLAIYAGVGIGKLTSWIRNSYHKTNDLSKASDTMKKSEEINKFDGVKKGYENFIGNHQGGIKLPDIKKFSTQKKENILGNKLSRTILRSFANIDKVPNRQKLNNLITSLKLDDFKDAATLKAKIFEKYPELDEVLSDNDIQNVVNESKALFSTSKKEDKKALEKLITSLEKEPHDYTKANMEVTKNLRAVINSDTYQALKEDPNNPYVLLVSHVSVAIWNEVQALPAYEEFGKTVLTKVNTEAINNREDLTPGEKRREILDKSHELTTKEIYTDHGLPAKILYAFTHVKQAFGSMASEGGVFREVAGAFGLDRYDSHGELSNNPSLQGVTTCEIAPGVNARINNCYGGSPTIGDRNKTVIAPEFLAACQASENKRFSEFKDPAIPDIIYYTNFQNIENAHGEGERSFVIMELVKKFPLSFYGMTLAKDSNFYMMQGEYKDAKWPGVEEFGKEVLKLFQNEKCYQYGDRATSRTKGETGNGFYLPGGSKAWLGTADQPGVIPNIINIANERFTEIEINARAKLKEGEQLDAVKLRGAYQEYVYSMIQAHTEITLAKKIHEETGDKAPLIMAIRACKENIDRGGAENAKYIHTRLPKDTENSDALVVGTMESRALSARGRTILDKRLPQVLGFIELIEPDQFENDMMRLYGISDMGINTPPVFAPAVKAPEEFDNEDSSSEDAPFIPFEDRPSI